MTVTVQVYVEDIATQLLTYTQVRLYSDTTPGGAFSTLVDTETLVAGQEVYTLTDSAGTPSTWYRYRLYNTTGPVQSDLSEAFQATGATLRNLRIEAAIECGAGFASTCSALGTTSTLIDAALRDSGVDTSFLEGAWIYRPDAAAAGDKVRRVNTDGFTVASGTLAPSRNWTNAPASGEVYQVFNLLPPVDAPGSAYSWDRAVRDGLNVCWFVDQVNLGEGTATGQTRFSLAAYGAGRNTVRRVFLRTEDSNGILFDYAVGRGESWWGLTDDGLGSLSLDLGIAPGTDETVIVELARVDAELYADTDTTACPQRLAVKAAAMKALEYLNGIARPGSYEGEYAAARGWFLSEYARHRPPPIVVGA